MLGVMLVYLVGYPILAAPLLRTATPPSSQGWPAIAVLSLALGALAIMSLSQRVAILVSFFLGSWMLLFEANLLLLSVNFGVLLTFVESLPILRLYQHTMEGITGGQAENVSSNLHFSLVEHLKAFYLVALAVVALAFFSTALFTSIVPRLGGQESLSVLALTALLTFIVITLVARGE